jgi:cyclophilin family peptidyl-prolyl cis-trans isomerase
MIARLGMKVIRLRRRQLLSTVAGAVAAIALASCGNNAQSTTCGGGKTLVTSWTSPPAMSIDPKKTYTAVITTSEGTMKASLFAEEAPKTVNNFAFLAKECFYNNVKFHRIIKDFMVQTGDPKGNGTGGPGYRFEDEPVKRQYKRGTLAMANAGRNTNGSQFFIIHKDYPLPPNYTIFGEVTEGLETLDKIASTPVSRSGSGENSVPTKDVTIQSVTIEES